VDKTVQDLGKAEEKGIRSTATFYIPITIWMKLEAFKTE
jgi:hypothetical protein